MKGVKWVISNRKKLNISPVEKVGFKNLLSAIRIRREELRNIINVGSVLFSKNSDQLRQLKHDFQQQKTTFKDAAERALLHYSLLSATMAGMDSLRRLDNIIDTMVHRNGFPGSGRGIRQSGGRIMMGNACFARLALFYLRRMAVGTAAQPRGWRFSFQMFRNEQVDLIAGELML